MRAQAWIMMKRLITILAFASSVTAYAEGGPLILKVHNADGNSFHVNSVLVSGKTDAILVDSGFTRADAFRIAAMVLDSGKTLKTIYISHADPDYYFGLSVLKQLFPDAKIVATAATVKKIQANIAKKIEFWSPKMGANAPGDITIPTALTTDALTLEGQTLEIRGDDERSRSYLWTPSIKAVVGGINVFAGLHVWTADTATSVDRNAWIKRLDEISALKPLLLIPGHSAAAEKQDLSQVEYTKKYLERFEIEQKKAKNSAELIYAMKKLYPKAGLDAAIDIGAKVVKGEMKW